MPLENDLTKILIIGSGPTLIGNVSETDVLTSDAIRALLEEDIQVILVNPNPATISTDKQPGVTVYLEPMSLDFLKRIIRMEEPSAIMPAYGSTMGLKVTRELVHDGILNQMGIRLLTLNEQTLRLHSHQQMATFLEQNELTVNRYWKLSDFASNDLEQQLAARVIFPVLVIKEEHYQHNKQAVFANAQAVVEYFKKERQNEDFSADRYQLTEDLSAWEEVILNIIRDRNGNTLITGLADTIEPVSINSGDSAAVMPALTLNNDQVQKIRQIAQQIANGLEMVGVLNMHFAVRHEGTKFAVKILTIKPRLTRSAIWVQRTALYSVGYVVCKVAIGYHLNEITDPLSGLSAAIEPTFDKVAIRMPFWSLIQSGCNHYNLGNRMQASGETIGIGRNFETAFMKGLTSTINTQIALSVFRREKAKEKDEIIQDLLHPDELHLIKVLAAISKGLNYQELQHLIFIHPVYYQKLEHLAKISCQLSAAEVTDELLLEAKKCGFTNVVISELTAINLDTLKKRLAKLQLKPSYLRIDGSAGIYAPRVQAYYSAYGVEDESAPPTANQKILVVGMLPLQVSVTNEFDYMISHALDTLHNNNYDTVLLSNNDESVATSYRRADKVYFEPISVENILNIAAKEQIKDVLLQFSGKEVNALGKKLVEYGLNVLGTHGVNPKDRIEQVLTGPMKTLKQNPLLTTVDSSEAKNFVNTHDFPILVGGFNNQGVKQKSAVVYDRPALKKYLAENQLSKISLSHFIEGNKYEITAISDGQDVTIPGIIEHLEQTGSHASDSIAVFKPQTLSKTNKKLLLEYAVDLIKRVHMRGIFTLHFLTAAKKIYLLQVKPFAGHNVAFLSKSLGKDITACATAVLTGQKLKELDYRSRLWPSNNFIYVKMPVFSYVDYNSDNTFDSKMKSSGAVTGRDTQLAKALYKGYEASGLRIPSFGTIFISVRDEDKDKMTALAQRFDRLGFKIVATEGTANVFAEAGITTGVVSKVHSEPNNLLKKIRQHKIVLVVNITNLSDTASGDAIRIRDEALNIHIPVFSSIETTELILTVLESLSLTTQPV
ncbi:carbamoyl phosphate synthase large subunit [Lactobacillus xylocopicola]|uniref:Carbamoyl-phosphate synthase (Glutamine-hydrolyzing) n=1 Tax=Lactobacillus xylocopicola TaxID=2976676 RepID=A0ABM8BHB6_9LACO|nr:carbamoyl phosphate synthase large subunit [Lactobacillus xylocopicola]BDR60494.1 carbamoyl-phosphate synthase (glutamine-hydrolyzing) [Lactobacillus xylocopicola]